MGATNTLAPSVHAVSCGRCWLSAGGVTLNPRLLGLTLSTPAEMENGCAHSLAANPLKSAVAAGYELREGQWHWAISVPGRRRLKPGYLLDFISLSGVIVWLAACTGFMGVNPPTTVKK